MSVAVGVDFGGTSIKAALVNVANGALMSEVKSTPTPSGGAVGPSMAAIASLVESFDHPIGVAFPSVIRQGHTLTAANIGKEWINANALAELQALLKRPVRLLNDADAAGLAEFHYGAGRDTHGSVLMLTFGTGIGSALFIDGKLWPNTELGHLNIDGQGAEVQASAKARTRDHLDFEQWAQRVDRVISEYHRLLWPDYIIVGGGVSEHFEQFAPLLKTPVSILPASLRQDAGIVGAAFSVIHVPQP
jgi:polyphosphate glucokinase